ncbi:MAG: bifunctional 5,10-methylenetetrahydrofolate dehydrogenase/5,10-methenyltetrahydrofolate cyclohydrolase [bacterium]
MATKILSGKEIADEILLNLRKKIVENENKNRIEPGFAVIMVGNDPASGLYVRNKKKACYKVGINFNDYHFAENANEDEILETIKFLNNDPSIFGIIVQLPLPENFGTSKIMKVILPKKDVDGFHPENIEKLISFLNSDLEDIDKIISPPVLKATITLLDQIEFLEGKKAVIISKNEIFAMPLREAISLKGIDAEIVLPFDKIDSLKEKDIIISAIGSPNFLKGKMIKEGAAIIDVGTTLVNGKLVGDVDFKSCEKKCSYISPVPGGVGPLTVAYLLENVIKAWEKSGLFYSTGI